MANDKGFDRYKSWRAVDVVRGVFVFFMAGLFPIVFNNMYFDITGTRAKTFIWAGLIFILAMAVAVFLELMLYKYYLVEDDWFYMDSKIAAMPEFWAGLFLLANIFSFIFADDKESAWTGATGRGFGLGMVIVLILCFVCLAREFEFDNLFFYVTAFIMIAAVTMAVLQHFKIDVAGFRENIKAADKEKFISFFGNMNTYGSYLATFIPVFVAAFVFSDKKFTKIIAGITIFVSALGVVPAKSDNVYLGTAVSFMLIFYLAVLAKRFLDFLYSMVIFMAGLSLISYLTVKFSGSKRAINGIAGFLRNETLLGVVLIAMVVICLVFTLFYYKKKDLFLKVQGKKTLIIITITFVVIGIVGIILGVNSSHTQIFKFDDEWGTYRGFIWKRSWRAFKAGNLIEKLFGYGNDSLLPVMKRMFYDDMIAATGKVYDNAHNEPLQFLVTTGIFGMVSYIGLYVSSFIYVMKRAKNDVVAISLFAGATGYIACGLVYLNQPITTPFYFVLLALAIGRIRYRDQGFGEFRSR